MLKFFNLVRRRRQSPEAYRAMQQYIAAATVQGLQQRGIDLATLRVLELGAGHGGYSQILAQHAGYFVASDLRWYPFFIRAQIPFCLLDAGAPFPFAEGSFDFVHCSSLIEHVAEPAVMLRACWRVLRPGGTLFLSFPPFYSLSMVGGHNFKPFHFLGERNAIRIINRLRGTQFERYANCYHTWGLYPLKMDQVYAWIADVGFEVVDVYPRLSPVNTTRLPGLLKDLFTGHACYLVRKPS